jgi:hypothetical protein
VTSLPALQHDRIPRSAIAPSIAWAGGSPDETLKPPPVPPKARAVPHVRGTELDRAASWNALHSAIARLKGADRLEFFYRVILSSTHRF